MNHSEGSERRRAAVYIRESTEEQGEGFSPDAQRQAIERFAQENELEVIEEYTDFHSGWRGAEKRPAFQRLMRDATAGCFDVVLVYHSSRFARNQVESRRYKTLLRERLGIAVVSVTQPLGDDPSDPSTFLSESIHEVFDVYYSVSLSFWTRAGLREKARQGHLIGQLPWGYQRDPQTAGVLPDPERAPLVTRLFELYATGEQSDRSLAQWLNSQGARTANGRPFSKDTVREMLVNAAYAGYISARRDTRRQQKGNHPPLIDPDLFERVQELRKTRTTTLNPGRPSAGYVLSKLLYCERCGGRMHGSSGGRNNVRRYYCSTRKQGGTCDQPVVLAQPLEEQLADYIRGFSPPHEVRKAIIRRLKTAAQTSSDADQRASRARLHGQLERLKELYLLNDLTKSQYLYRRQLLQQQLDTLEPPIVADLTQAAQLLTNFALFWERETNPGERNKLLRVVLERVHADDGQLIAVTPRQPFLPYFQFGTQQSAGKERERRDSNPRPPA